MDDIPYESLIKESNDGILVARNGEIVYANERLQELTGFAEATLVGAPKTMLVTDDDAALVKQYHSARTSGEDAPDQYEVTLETKSGDRIPIEFSVNEISYDGEPAVVAFCRDITERKEREKELSRYRAFVENTSDVITIISGDGTAEYVSSASRHVSGHEPEELVGTEAIEHVHPADQEAVSEKLAELTATPGSRATAEYRFQHADGSWIWVESTGINRLEDPKIEGVVLVSRDITGRKERERQIQELKERLELAIEGAELGVWDWNVKTDEVEFNDQWAEMLGYDPANIDDHLDAWEKRVHPGDLSEVEATLESHLAGETEYYDSEHRMKTADGGWKWIRDIGKVVERDDDGDPVRAVGIHFDIDERKSYEQTLEEERDMFTQGPAVLFKWKDAEGWPVEFVSENVENITEYSPDQFTSGEVAYAELVHDADLDRVTEEVAENSEEGIDRFSHEPYRIVTADGDVRWVLDHTKNVWDDGEITHRQGYLVDITERKRREQELKESKEQITEQNNALESFTGIVTDAERTVDQQITDLLDLGASYLDLDIGILSEIDGSEYTVRNVVATGDTVEPGDTFDLTDTYCSLVYDADGPVVFHSADAGSVKDHPAYQNRGMEAYVGVPVVVDGQRYGTLNFSRPESRETPITDAEESFVRIMAEWIGTELTRQQRKQELKRTSQFLQDSQEVANIGGWEVGLQSETLRWSEQVYRIHGLPLDASPTPEDGIEFYHPEDRDTIREAFNRLTTEGEPYDLELRIIRADNDEVRWVRTRGEPRYEDDEIVAVHGTFQDITKRKEREQELNRSQQIIENSTDIATIIDPEGTITYVSSAVKHVLGYDPEELIGANGYRYQPEETRRNVADAIEHVLDNPGETKTIQTRFRRADDSWCWIESTLRNRLDDDVIDGILISSRDITKRKRREQKLEQFREAVEQTGHAVYITDTDGTIEYVNPAFEEITGYSETEAVGETPQLLSADEHDEAFHEDLWETVRDGKRWENEMVDKRADGEEIVLYQIISPLTDSDGEPQKFVAVARDITERKEYEEALEATREKLRQIIDLVPDLIFVKNREGEYLLANETTADFYGMEPEDVEGRHETEVIPSVDDSEQFRQYDIEVIESGEPKFIPEEELTTADGETRILQTTKIPYQVPESGEEAVLGYARDVSELTEYQHKLESQRDNLEILNQVVRHDIRNDLQLVLTYGETLTNYIDTEGEEYVEQILDATRDAIDITTTARDVTRVMLQSDVELEPVQLRPALESEVYDVRSNYEAALVRIDGTIPNIEVLGDGMLESVFRNLMKNAIQHNDKEVPKVSVSTTREDDIVAVHIADNGPGISDERKETIFQQGEVGLDSEGTGLGLYLVETLVDRYGGSVYVEDNDPTGAIFVVELPVSA